MYKLLQVFQQNVTEGPGVYSTSTHLWEIIVMLLGAAILGYLLCYFTKSRAVAEKTTAKTLAPAAPEVNEWEVKYKSFQANYEQNKAEWQQKYQSSEDRAKTFQHQLAEIKTLHENTELEKAAFTGKLRLMEAQRNEALENTKKVLSELSGAGENIKAQQEKINTLSAALAKASLVKTEAPKPVIISDAELTKKYETEAGALKKQLEEKDKRLISLLSKEAAANELQLRNDKLATENKVFRNEMATANLSTEAALEKAQQLKDLQLQVLSLSNKVALANGEATNLKKQLADQQKRHQQQAGKLNELRMAIGTERNAMKARIVALENELAPFKPVPAVIAEPTIAVPGTEQVTETVPPAPEAQIAAPVVEQTITPSPEMDATPVVVDSPAPLLQEVLPSAKTGELPEVNIPATKTDTDDLPPAEPATIPVTTPEITGNDILKIQGINAAAKALLESEGIDSWAKLAKTTPATLKAILTEKGGEQLAAINPKSWPIQAQLLADGKWDAFASYTQYLIDGVDPEEVQA